MRVFLTWTFDRFARKEKLEDSILLKTITQAERGLVAADLGGCLWKLRVPRSGRGKSGGYRTIVAYRKGDKCFYLFGWSKNDIANISKEEQARLEKFGAALLGVDESWINKSIQLGELREIKEEEDHG